MRISVVIPTFNFGRYLREALESVLAQTVPVDEILVVDDGSTDDTPAVLARLADPRLRVFRTANQGVSRSRNLGLDEATGDVIAFLDADDRWRPEKWEYERALLESEPEVGVVFSNFVRFRDRQVFPSDQFTFFPELSSVPTRPARSGRGTVISGDAFAHLIGFGEFPAWGGASTFRASVVRALRFAPELPICEDLHFCLRAYSGCAVAFFAEPLLEVRRHAENATRRPSEISGFKLLALQMLERESLTPSQRHALRRRIARQLVTVGADNARNRDLGGALRGFARAVACDPARLASVAKQMALLPYTWITADARGRDA